MILYFTEIDLIEFEINLNEQPKTNHLIDYTNDFEIKANKLSEQQLICFIEALHQSNIYNNLLIFK
jgi:hypothetical protein